MVLRRALHRPCLVTVPEIFFNRRRRGAAPSPAEVVVPKLTDETLRKMSAMNLLFAASSLGLLATMGWMVYDDYSRGWKMYQKKFQRLEAEKTHAQIDAAEKAVDKDTLDALLKERAEAEAAAKQHAKGLEEAQKK